MTQEIALFWLVLAGMLAFDNLVLVPTGADCLRLSSKGRLRYPPERRMQVLRRDLLLLNPLNPFDRLVLTEQSIGAISVAQWRQSLQQIRHALPVTNQLSLLGSTYLLALSVFAMASVGTYFGTVLLALAVAHLAVWAVAIWLLVTNRQALQLGSSRAFGLALEALLVPGYLVNLGKRVWVRQTLPLAAFTLGLRQLKRRHPGPALELYHARMCQRLDDLAFELGLDEELTPDAAEPGEAVGTKPSPSALKQHPAPSLQTWLQEARACLTTSAPSNGL